MALINCPECNKSVSDMAPACPDCAYPLTQKAFTTTGDYSATTTIQQTNKRWKKMQLIAAACIISGIIVSNIDGIRMLMLPLMLYGLVTAIYSMFGAWWENS